MRPPPRSRLTRALAGTVMVLAIVAGAAGPAAAHAVLLRTEPSPQTTVPTAPTAVRLQFSESVEAAFGAVRVYDVDGRRVDRGKLTTEKGGRDVVVPADLASGTYTVTWRVVSTDGHAIHGAFQFYVESPSTISPVPVELDTGAGRVVGWGYGVVRFAWYLAFLALVGLVVVHRFVWTPALRAAGLDDSAAETRFERGFRRTLPLAWGALLIAWMVRLVFQTASISGLGLAESARPGVLGDVLGTSFGRAWLAGLAFTILAGLAVAGLSRRRGLFGARTETWLSVMAAGTVGVALALANTGHASTEGNPTLGVPSVAVHLLAVSVWVGGLGVLAALGAAAWSRVAPERRDAFVGGLVGRFSRLALAAVAVLVVTGILNSILDLASVSDLWDTNYGRVLVTKIALLAVALVFGAWHLRVAPRRLGAAGSVGRASRGFRRSSALELVVLTTAVGFASALVALIPGRSLAEIERGPVNEEQPVGRYTLQLFIDPSAPGRNEIHLTFVDANGLGAGDISGVTATLVTADGPAAPLDPRLLSVGHFVATTDLTPGAHRLAVNVPAPSGGLSTSFSFRIRDEGAAQGG